MAGIDLRETECGTRRSRGGPPSIALRGGIASVNRGIPVLALGAILMGFGALGCSSRSESDPRPNIIVLTVDTLRSDHLETYGYSRSTMPMVDRFAETATVFENAVVPRGSTRPSYGSMLTGQYPHHHGVRSNRILLHGDVTTLAERLQSEGYHTAGFVSNFVLLGELSGMDQGFDLYDDLLTDREGTRLNFERRAAGTLQAMIRWLASEPPEPFFLFVNFIDPHGPYTPPEKYREMYATDRHRQLVPGKVPPYQVHGDSLNFFDYVDRYDAELRYTDDALGVFIDRLRSAQLWDDALVVFTADHGEALGEHGQYFGHHSFLWEETTKVPMAIRLPSSARARSPQPKRAQTVASPLDLTPTILDFLRLEQGAEFDGRSLLSVLEGTEDSERAIFVEFPNATTPGANHPDIYAMRGQESKLIRMRDPNTRETMAESVSDLIEDPLESRPAVFDPNDPDHLRLAAALDSVLHELDRFELPFVVTEYLMPHEERNEFLQGRDANRIVRNLTPDQEERMRSLGYIQ